MMDSGTMSTMMGGNASSMMFFGWVTYVLILALIILAIAALWKYLQK